MIQPGEEMNRQDAISRDMESICLQILADARNELYMNMRYLDLALSGLRFQITTDVQGIGTDGRIFFAYPNLLADLYEENRLLINRLYLHAVLHCLLRHLFKRPGQNRILWDLACDIAVESVISSLRCRAVRMGESVLRRSTFEKLGKALPVLTAEGIYRELCSRDLSPELLLRLQREFGPDDHSLWPQLPQDKDTPPPPVIEQLQRSWEEISEKTQTQMETFAQEEASGAEAVLESLEVAGRERRSYADFLRRFAVLREEIRIDPDTFDYVFYSFGLRTYGNLPLIEPQEVKESLKIEEFVVVIDVSMSTSGAMVRQFLEETYGVLSEKESFLRKVHLRILQCDEKVVEDRKITSREELDEYMSRFELKGGGGTDFRPAFEYVRELLETKQMTQLKGMLYFTDGKGIYPSRKPPWETAFVFTHEQRNLPEVPVWAIRLVLPESMGERE